MFELIGYVVLRMAGMGWLWGTQAHVKQGQYEVNEMTGGLTFIVGLSSILVFFFIVIPLLQWMGWLS